MIYKLIMRGAPKNPYELASRPARREPPRGLTAFALRLRVLISTCSENLRLALTSVTATVLMSTLSSPSPRA